MSVGVIRKGQLSPEWIHTVQASDIRYTPDLSGCSKLAKWNDDFTKFAVAFQGPDGTSHAGIVDVATKEIVDLTAPRAMTGFAAAAATDSGTMFLAADPTRARFPGDAVVVTGTDPTGLLATNVIAVADPSVVQPWTGHPRGPLKPSTGSDEGVYWHSAHTFNDGYATDFVSPDGRWTLGGRPDAYLAPAGECPGDCAIDLDSSICPDHYGMVALGWKDANTAVLYDYDESGRNTDASGIVLVNVNGGRPGGCVDVVPAHAKPLKRAALRADGQMAYIQFDGPSEPWWGVDLSTPGAEPTQTTLTPMYEDGVYIFDWTDRT